MELNLFKVTIFAALVGFHHATLAQTECYRQSSGDFAVQDPYNGRVFDLSPVVVDQVQLLHQDVLYALTPTYFQRNLEQGLCIETARNVMQWLSNRKIQGVKVNIQTENGGFVGATGASFLDGGAVDGNVFLFQSPLDGAVYSWGHHVSVAICVVESESSQRGSIVVLDPSILRYGVGIEVWQNLLINSLPNPNDTSSWSLNFLKN